MLEFAKDYMENVFPPIVEDLYEGFSTNDNKKVQETLKDELKLFVSNEISPIAKPDIIQWAPGLPKTRSGKIMRRILRKIADGDFANLGDTSTLADPSVVEDLIASREIYEK